MHSLMLLGEVLVKQMAKVCRVCVFVMGDSVCNLLLKLVGSLRFDMADLVVP